jgi:hypothetical protein
MTNRRILIGLGISLSLGLVTPARADVVTDWNAVTVTYVALGNAAASPPIPVGRPGPPGLMDIALVHLAIHDAVQAIDGQYEPYHYSDPSKLGVGSREAAVAAAAHRALVLIYPGQKTSLDATYASYLTAHGINAQDPGIAAGEASATALYAHHYRAPLTPAPFFGVTEPGQWRSAVPMAFLELIYQAPFTLERNSQFRPPSPPPMNSVPYAREYDEVKTRGNTLAQSTEQVTLGRFWSGNFFAQWNESLRRIAIANISDIGDSARLFALANMAAADGAMATWEAKYFYNFWRPSMAIQGGADDRNSRTAPDPAWTPFLANPAYPDYVSGANAVTASFTATLREFFGTDDLSFSVKSIPFQAANPERFFDAISQAEDEVVDARIVLGIHFRSADEEARRLGNRVSHWVFQKFLKPVPGSK